MTGRRPFDHVERDAAVIQKVLTGNRPDRPTVGFSEPLWALLNKTWLEERESSPPVRPDIANILRLLEYEAQTWSPTGRFLGGNFEDTASPEVGMLDEGPVNSFIPRGPSNLQPGCQNMNRPRPQGPDAGGFPEFRQNTNDPNSMSPIPKQRLPLDLTRELNAELSQEVDHIISLFKNESGSRQPLNLERDQVQDYANTLDAVSIPWCWCPD